MIVSWRPAAALLLVPLSWVLLSWPGVARAAPEALAVESIQRRLDTERPAVERVGSLRAFGVLELRSGDSRLGGLSGLLVSTDGRRLEAVSDEGNWISLRLDYDAEGRLIGAGEGRIAALTDRDGQPLVGKEFQDAESLARDGSGGLLVAFEHHHRIWRYPTVGSPPARRPEPLPPPAALANQPANEGIEALERLADGSLLAIGSKTARPDLYPAFLLRPPFGLHPDRWESLWYRRSGPYEPTGAAVLPDGDLLVLERRFSLLGGLAVRVMRVAAASIRPGATLDGRELAVIRPPLTVDNYEGIAARRGAGGETFVYLISDSNFNFLQRTLLLQFLLED